MQTQYEQIIKALKLHINIHVGPSSSVGRAGNTSTEAVYTPRVHIRPTALCCKSPFSLTPLSVISQAVLPNKAMKGQ